MKKGATGGLLSNDNDFGGIEKATDRGAVGTRDVSKFEDVWLSLKMLKSHHREVEGDGLGVDKQSFIRTVTLA
ncbi:hypothetical protein HPP92_004968 [Vanilla planifolia]|uniref:Uncharacterized protein n=1 Tax=Vanilla planifolia TaxID=51239 RepID=A0A835VAW5_VANPL|nr:hypothetical protein HPP92_004968 [Vanilla planifolia]